MGVAISEEAQRAMRAGHASAESLVIGPERDGRREKAPGRAVFYRLSRKFLDEDRPMPQGARDILYYTLAVGHNTGVIDCFDEALSCPMAAYRRVVGRYPQGDARYKLEGLLRRQEIQVDSSHVATLLPPTLDVCDALAQEEGPEAAEELEWARAFAGLLRLIEENHVVYLMGRVRD